MTVIFDSFLILTPRVRLAQKWIRRSNRKSRRHAGLRVYETGRLAESFPARATIPQHIRTDPSGRADSNRSVDKHGRGWD